MIQENETLGKEDRLRKLLKQAKASQVGTVRNFPPKGRLQHRRHRSVLQKVKHGIAVPGEKVIALMCLSTEVKFV